MTNVELKERVENIIAIEDYFDRSIAISNFENDYKKSDFFKITKKPLDNLVRDYRIDNLLSIKKLRKGLQEILDKLDFTNIDDTLNKISDTFGQENSEIIDTIKDFKEILGK